MGAVHLFIYLFIYSVGQKKNFKHCSSFQKRWQARSLCDLCCQYLAGLWL